MKEITDKILLYRECHRHLWNSYFTRIDWVEPEWDYQDYFFDISKILLRDTVLRQVSEGKEIEKNKDGYYDEINVIPNLGPAGINTMWARITGNVVEWKVLQLVTNSNDFRFIEFFDWTFDNTMEAQYARLRLVNSKEFPELVGADFLFEIWNVNFFFIV